MKKTGKKTSKKTNKRLGRGIGSLLKVDLNEEEAEQKPEKINLKSPQKEISEEQMVLDVDVTDVYPNKEQPRKHFDEESLKELSDSIKVQGIMQPIVTVKKDNGYEIIAGERRWRAAQKAGLKRVPIIVRKVDERKKLEWAIIENVQRSDLNPIEEGEEDSIKSYRQLKDKRSFVDMGSGNGLPGLIFSILDEDINVTLVDIDKKKCEFLKTMIYRLKLNATVLHKSIFDIEVDKVPRGTVFLYRAFSPKAAASDFISKNKDLNHAYFASSHQNLEISHKKEFYYELSNGVSRKLLIF